MRDFAYEEVVQGNGTETMATPLTFSPGTCVEGKPIHNTRVLMNFNDDFKGEFVPASALAPAIAAAKKLLTQLSPHSHEDWIDCFSLEHLKQIPLCKVQVESAQKKTPHAKPEDSAAEDVERTKKTANHLRGLFEKAQRGMSGEDFVKELHESPDIDLARQMLRRANAGGADVTTPGGAILSPNTGKPVQELACAESQTVKIKVGVEPPRGGLISATVVDPLEHAEFWKHFPDKLVALEVVDADDQECLLLSQVLKEPLIVQINVTVVSPHGRMTREGVQASLSRSLDHRGLAQRVVKRLSSQFDLKF
ncbi:hypothetical protein [Scleromatobacter humisilvae]|uniref:Uncharacterized protein n=1 Tax=Scleromatobacter humisilvae TaxID=2897159 RepID=A0A9X2C243_9BURK|nr:hypothetical protein [Scleromatobacter humisilvae]MCK9685640.1 hypothetical protein [Scleromatobacter humisilvae]